jgi:hypothetical protein
VTADEPDLVTLLYRADWTGLSLTANIHGMVDYDLLAKLDEGWHPPGLRAFDHYAATGVRNFHHRLFIAPGGRYHVEGDSTDDEFKLSFGEHEQDEDPDDGPDEADDGAPIPWDDGESWLPPRYWAILRPRRLLSGFTLTAGETTEYSGRAALRATVTSGSLVTFVAARTDWSLDRALDRIEVIVDAETGILLRREEIFNGRTLRLTELTEVRFGPLDPADAAKFGAAAEAPDVEDPDSDGPSDAGSGGFAAGGRTAKSAVNTVGGLLGAAIKHSPRRDSKRDADGPDAAMPQDDPFPADWNADSPGDDADDAGESISDELLRSLHRSGTASVTGTLHVWTDIAQAADFAGSWTTRHGLAGIAAVVDAVGARVGTAYMAMRIRVSQGRRYRIDYEVNPGHRKPDAVVCDGEQRWREYSDRIAVGPAAAPVDHVTGPMIDASWLLQCKLSGETEMSLGGRRAFAIRISVDEYSHFSPPMFAHEAQAIVDAELGILLLLVALVGGKPFTRHEFRGVAPSPASDADDAEAFRVEIPPGVRVVHQRGDLLDEIDMPDPVRTVVRSAGEAAGAARGFLDSIFRDHGSRR